MFIDLEPKWIGKPDGDEDDEGNWQERKLAAKYEVCSMCEGKGSIVNPNIDGNGLTARDIDRLGGDEFMEDYMSGVYDIKCPECEGLRVVMVPDEDRADPELLKEYLDEQQEIYESKRMEEMERRAETFYEDRASYYGDY